MKIDNLEIFVADTRQEMGEMAALAFENEAMKLLKKDEFLRIVFASAPSQVEFLQALLEDNVLAWDKIEAFHMDEYMGLSPASPQSFAYFIEQTLLSKRNFLSKNFIDGSIDVQTMIRNYTALLSSKPISLVGMGIGENGHIAFNDPPVADFNDKAWIKAVVLDEKCRIQQVNDGCFASLDLVPKTALTLTVPALFSAQSLICVVPGKLKAEAVRNTLFGEISEKCPASILRTHPNAKLFLDKDSAMYL
ncbi:MAG: 6-phosphogluconolactonase [Bacteroidales bacterium]|nr:6-phosphogluconolactonase [Bacteroidales bacterium]